MTQEQRIAEIKRLTEIKNTLMTQVSDTAAAVRELAAQIERMKERLTDDTRSGDNIRPIT